jgi:hypothetical protein
LEKRRKQAAEMGKKKEKKRKQRGQNFWETNLKKRTE